MDSIYRNISKYPVWNMKSEVEFIDEWFLMKSPFPLLIIMISYWLFVLKLGPMYMEYRMPFKLTKTLAVYNAFQVVISWMIFFYAEYFYCTLHSGFSVAAPFLSLVYIKIFKWIRSRMAAGDKGSNMIVKNGFFPKTCFQNSIETAPYDYFPGAIHFFFTAKLTELLDTVFFVLRKKSNQVTFLHVYHHTITVIVSWIVLKTDPFATIGVAPFLGATNALVHVVMYTYYGLSAFPELTKYLWWKKYITKMQLVQFVILTIHMAIEFHISKCKISRVIMGTLLFHMFLFLYLFADFYIKTYYGDRKTNKSDLNNVKDYGHKIHFAKNPNTYKYGELNSRASKIKI